MRERSTEILVAIVILVLAVENDVQADTQHKVAIIGSGNWGSAIGKIAARNAARSARIQTEVACDCAPVRMGQSHRHR
jgi:NADH/NAD ratio-sensing transcriptional regulator Rex